MQPSAPFVAHSAISCLHAQDLGAQQAEEPAALLGALGGLEADTLLRLCGDAAEMRCPLVQALASEGARRLVVIQERASWRQSVTGVLWLCLDCGDSGLSFAMLSEAFTCDGRVATHARKDRELTLTHALGILRSLSSTVHTHGTFNKYAGNMGCEALCTAGSDVLKAAAAAEAPAGCAADIVAVWLASLLWLEDGRWRKLRSGGAPTDSLEVLLDALSLPAAAHAGEPTASAAPPQDEAFAQPSAQERAFLSDISPSAQVRDQL
jgi:hypothetical protein